MGVPKFYRWLSERYPKINQVIKTALKPEFDCLYLDMNGIVHNCTHPEEDKDKGPNSTGSLHVRMSEEEMWLNIFQYIEKLVNIARPKKLLYMAIDGVAPRAKMNQQRQRRFRSADETKQKRDEACRRGETLPPGDPFDSNCITPGTEFMETLSTMLRYFIQKKVREDPIWQNIQIIFSGAEVPGEGEHKIMAYIRQMKMQPDYEPNLRHCLYGLDADLIMLALVSHEPHFALLREEVIFGPSNNLGLPRRAMKKADEFQFLHISVLREYLDMEFRNDSLPFGYDLERIIDDFVLMCFFVGNDFLPHLPTLDIAEGGLDTLFAIYKKDLPEMGYLTNGSQLNLANLERIFKQLGEKEEEVFEIRFAEQQQFRDRQRRQHQYSVSRGWEKEEREEAEEEFDEAADTKKLDSKIQQLQGKANLINDDLSFTGRYYREKFRSFYDNARLSDKEIGEKEAKKAASIEDSPSSPSDVSVSSGKEEGGNSEGEGNDLPEIERNTNRDHSIIFTQPTSGSSIGSGSGSQSTNSQSQSKRDKAAKGQRGSGSGSGGNGSGGNSSGGDGERGGERGGKRGGKKTKAHKGRRARRAEKNGRKDGIEDHFSEEKINHSIRLLSRSFLEGLFWVQNYYYRGVASWKWFYDYRYAPLASSLLNLNELMKDAAIPGDSDGYIKLNFELGEPFRPLEQLLGVLPPASAKFLPTPYQALMLKEDSPIKEFYPATFEVDMNGKKNPWEGVALIPFIDEKRLLGAIQSILLSDLTEKEIKRNQRTGADFSFRYDLDYKDNYISPLKSPRFPDLPSCQCKSVVFHLPPYPSSGTGTFVPKLCKDVRIPYSGYPFLNFLSISARLQNVGVNVFGRESRKDSLIVSIKRAGSSGSNSTNEKKKPQEKQPQQKKTDQRDNRERDNRDRDRDNRNRDRGGGDQSHQPPRSEPGEIEADRTTAARLPGKRIWVEWPFLREALVMACYDTHNRYGKNYRQQLQSYDASQNQKEMQMIYHKHLFQGVDIGPVNVLVTVRLFVGMKRMPDGATKKWFAQDDITVPLQLCVFQNPAADVRFQELPPPTLHEAFPLHSHIIYIGKDYFGAMGTVEAYSSERKSGDSKDGTLQVKLTLPLPEPDFTHHLSQKSRLEFYPAHQVAKTLHITLVVLSKICSSVFVNPGHIDVGLNLKFAVKSLALPEYARRVERKQSGYEGDKNNYYNSNPSHEWEYSELTAAMVLAYKKRFPTVFQQLHNYPDAKSYDASTLAGSGDGADRKSGIEALREIVTWLDSLPTRNLILIPTTSELIPGRGVRITEEETKRHRTIMKGYKCGEMTLTNVPMRLLYRPSPLIPWSPTEYERPVLGDRVINLRADEGVPEGLRGTIVGVHGQFVEVVFDEEYMSGSTLRGRCSHGRGSTLPITSLFNLSKPREVPLLKNQTPASEPKPQILSKTPSEKTPFFELKTFEFVSTASTLSHLMEPPKSSKHPTRGSTEETKQNSQKQPVQILKKSPPKQSTSQSTSPTPSSSHQGAPQTSDVESTGPQTRGKPQHQQHQQHQPQYRDHNNQRQQYHQQQYHQQQYHQQHQQRHQQHQQQHLDSRGGASVGGKQQWIARKHDKQQPPSSSYHSQQQSSTSQQTSHPQILKRDHSLSQHDVRAGSAPFSHTEGSFPDSTVNPLLVISKHGGPHIPTPAPRGSTAYPNPPGLSQNPSNTPPGEDQNALVNFWQVLQNQANSNSGGRSPQSSQRYHNQYPSRPTYQHYQHTPREGSLVQAYELQQQQQFYQNYIKPSSPPPSSSVSTTEGSKVNSPTTSAPSMLQAFASLQIGQEPKSNLEQQQQKDDPSHKNVSSSSLVNQKIVDSSSSSSSSSSMSQSLAKSESHPPSTIDPQFTLESSSSSTSTSSSLSPSSSSSSSSSTSDVSSSDPSSVSSSSESSIPATSTTTTPATSAASSSSSSKTDQKDNKSRGPNQGGGGRGGYKPGNNVGRGNSSAPRPYTKGQYIPYQIPGNNSGYNNNSHFYSEDPYNHPPHPLPLFPAYNHHPFPYDPSSGYSGGIPPQMGGGGGSGSRQPPLLSYPSYSHPNQGRFQGHPRGGGGPPYHPPRRQ